MENLPLNSETTKIKLVTAITKMTLDGKLDWYDSKLDVHPTQRREITNFSASAQDSNYKYVLYIRTIGIEQFIELHTTNLSKYITLDILDLNEKLLASISNVQGLHDLYTTVKDHVTNEMNNLEKIFSTMKNSA